MIVNVVLQCTYYCFLSQGNTHFKNRQYEGAVECYGRAMEFDPSSPIMPANRAMALIKLGK